MRGNNQKNSNIIIKTCILMSLIIFLLCFIVILCIAFSSDDTYEIENNGERYGKSEFYKYKDKIYVLVIGSGMLEVEGVDIPTFKVFNKDKEDERENVGFDKNRIYFGNIAVSDLDTDKLYYVGNNYYSDGTNSYFCSTSPKFNEELSAGSTIIQNVSHFFFKTREPQYYFYPYKKLETNKRLKKIEELRNFATNGEEVYYAGEELANADINTIKKIEEGLFYFVDKENVYYKSKLLPIKNSGKLKVVSTEQGDRFLYDEANGYVFIEDYSFDREKAPYKVIGNNGSHLYNLAFVSNEGIYYYDNQKKKQKRAGDNIFTGNVEELSPNVFTDDKNIYYFHAYDVWKRYKNAGDVLFSQNTEICYLDKKDGWEKVKDIRGGIIGAIWKKGNRYYYFDNLGMSQLINNAIYEITDKKVLEYLLLNADEIGSSDSIGEFIENGKLIAIDGEKKVEIVVKYKSAVITMARYSKIFLAIIVVVSVIIKIIRGLRK
ncbi:hypothetical protein RN90_08890 [Fusobacterium animalis]|uniref:Fusobacterium membrane protein n=1 Tax=Fusobacterium animalis TaxID=76859 RepID=A0A2B7YWE7_9FUSO|nr:DKNYY domain-containing protein [Fusobacterium animalis]PGH25480.1 hypothetical protein RN90_08890 [Fusobacterium animalis]